MALNAEQQRAVECEDNLLVLAPPGSGKTGTLVEKTRHIITSNPRSQIMLVTFTDASSSEAHERIEKLLSPAEMSRIKVATFHKHAMAQLRAVNRLGKLIFPRESTDLLRKALATVGSTLELREAEEKLQAAKATPNYTGIEEDFIAEYERMKQRLRGLDLQDVTRECVVGMESTDPAASIPPLPVTHVLCDEFQDVDHNQLAWLLGYQKAGATVTVVGDDDQSVYGWRSSLGYEAMQMFIDASSPTIIHLEINYRSKSEILVAATSLIRKNASRMDKNIISMRGDGGTVQQVSSANMHFAADAIGDLILEDGKSLDAKDAKVPGRKPIIEQVKQPEEGEPAIVPRVRMPLGRWGIIGRTNQDLWLVAAVLRKHNISYNKKASKDGPPEAVAMFCDFLISLQTGDSMGLGNLLLAREVAFKTVDDIHAKMQDDFYTIMDGTVPDLEGVPFDDADKIKDFCAICSNWRGMLRVERNGKFIAQYKRVIEAVGYYFTSYKLIKNEELVSDFESFVSMLCAERGNLQQRINRLLRTEDSKDNAGVSLCTMHGSKGLEFDRVVVVQCNSGNIPAPRSASVEEERRLFYVAMTRARLDLTLSYISTKGPSLFLSEFAA